MIINRVWEMPNKNTFDIKCIKRLIHKYITPGLLVIDPFANSNKIASVTNDIDPTYCTTYNMDALDFLKTFSNNSVDIVLFDPPYSPRQVSESYKKLDLSVNMQTTQSSFWGNLKNQISRITKEGSIVISCSWNSGGIGKTKGFEMIEILMVSHGGWHNDTLCVVERKFKKNKLF